MCDDSIPLRTDPVHDSFFQTGELLERIQRNGFGPIGQLVGCLQKTLPVGQTKGELYVS